MSLRDAVRAAPTMLRVGFAEAFAYRAEMLVWILATTMPLVMLAIWHAVAREAPVGRFGESDMVAYFLAMFVVRQLTGSWSAWLINMEVRDGTLALRLLKPVHPLFSYALGSVAELPVRSILATPVAAGALLWFAGDRVTHDPTMLLFFAISVLGGWLITLAANFAVGCLSLFLESSMKVWDVWLALFFVFSGYVVPVELFPDRVRGSLDYLPFRYQLGLPVELLTGAHDRDAALSLLGRQGLMVCLAFAVVAVVWRRGLRRFAAYGG